jgi:hypothetical protein
MLCTQPYMYCHAKIRILYDVTSLQFLYVFLFVVRGYLLSPVRHFLEPRHVTGIACRSVSSNLGARAPRKFSIEIHIAIKTRA